MRYLFIIIFALSTAYSSAQSNLIYNGNIEIPYSIPCTGGIYIIDDVPNYWNPIFTSSDIFHPCNMTYPTNSLAGFQIDIHNEFSYAGIITYLQEDTTYREYIMCKIKNKLEINKHYKIIFHVSNADFHPYITNIGCCFEKDSVFHLPRNNFVPTYPDYTFMTDYVISDCNSWSEISFEFIPTIDDLQYLVIGSFPETKPLIVFNNNPLLFCSVGGDPIEHYAYYLIDDVRLYCLDCDTNSYCTLALPDAFTPNADGLNDEWKPLINTDCDADIDNYLLRIFNRWGEVVFTSHDKNETWKGMNNEIGTYVYYLQYDDKQRTQIKQGSVELIR